MVLFPDSPAPAESNYYVQLNNSYTCPNQVQYVVYNCKWIKIMVKHLNHELTTGP